MISNNFNVILVLVLAFGSTSYATLCYECTEYDNQHQEQADTSNDHFIDFTNGERSIDKLCHGMTGSYAERLLVNCDGSCTYAVVQSDEYVTATYRACAKNLSCANFVPPLNGTEVKLCKTCGEDRCNFNEDLIPPTATPTPTPKPDSAVSNGVSVFFVFISFFLTYINVLS